MDHHDERVLVKFGNESFEILLFSSLSSREKLNKTELNVSLAPKDKEIFQDHIFKKNAKMWNSKKTFIVFVPVGTVNQSTLSDLATKILKEEEQSLIIVQEEPGKMGKLLKAFKSFVVSGLGNEEALPHFVPPNGKILILSAEQYQKLNSSKASHLKIFLPLRANRIEEILKEMGGGDPDRVHNAFIELTEGWLMGSNEVTERQTSDSFTHHMLSLDKYATPTNLPWILALEKRRMVSESPEKINEHIASIFRTFILSGNWDMDSFKFLSSKERTSQPKKKSGRNTIMELLLCFMKTERILTERNIAQLFVLFVVVKWNASIARFIETLNERKETIDKNDKMESLLFPRQVKMMLELGNGVLLKTLFLEAKGESRYFFFRLADELLREDSKTNNPRFSKLFHDHRNVLKQVLFAPEEVVHSSLTDPVQSAISREVSSFINDCNIFEDIFKADESAYIWSSKKEVGNAFRDAYEGIKKRSTYVWTGDLYIREKLDLLHNGHKHGILSFDEIMKYFMELFSNSFPDVVSHYSHPLMQCLPERLTIRSQYSPEDLFQRTVEKIRFTSKSVISGEEERVLKIFAKALSEEMGGDVDYFLLVSPPRYSSYYNYSFLCNFFMDAFIEAMSIKLRIQENFHDLHTLIESMRLEGGVVSTNSMRFQLCDKHFCALQEKDSESVKVLEKSKVLLNYRNYDVLKTLLLDHKASGKPKARRGNNSDDQKSRFFIFLQHLKESCEKEFCSLSSLTAIEGCFSMVHGFLRSEFIDETLLFQLFQVDSQWFDGPRAWENGSLGELHHFVHSTQLWYSSLDCHKKAVMDTICSSEYAPDEMPSIILRKFIKDEIYEHSKTASAKQLTILSEGLTAATQRVKNILTEIATQNISHQEVLRLKSLCPESFLSDIRQLNTFMARIGICEDGKDVLSVIEDMENHVLFLHHVKALFAPHDGNKSTLDQFEFKCWNDSDVQNLVSFVQNGFPVDSIRFFNGAADKILLSFDQGWTIRAATKFCFLLSSLSKMKNQWSFFKQNSVFLSDNHVGYSSVFDEKLEELISQAPRQKLTILQNFKYASFFISTLLQQTQTSTFKELTRWVWSDKRFSEAFQKEEELVSDYSFPLVAVMESVDKEMDVIADLIQRGLNQLEMVKYQFESIRQNGFSYFFDIETMEEMMEFDENVKFRMHLNAEQIRDFVRRLEFTACDPETQQDMPQKDVAVFLKEMELYSESLKVMSHLRALGHPDFSPAKRVVIAETKSPHIDSSFTPLERSLLANLDNVVFEWRKTIETKMESNPLMALLSVPSALALSRAVQEPERDVFQMLSIISPLFANDIQGEIELENRIKNIDSIGDHVSSDSLLNIADDFIQKLQPKWDITHDDKAMFPPKGCQLFQCQNEYEILVALQEIYDHRSPYPFEILWCTSQLYFLSVEQMLLRAKLFPSFRFTFVHSDALPYSAQTSIIHALVKEGISNLFFIERSESILRAAYNLKVVKNCIKPLSDSFFQLNSVRCFIGDSGSGKSYQIHKFISSEENKGAKLSCLLVVSEDVVLDDMVSQLLKGIRQCLSRQRDMILAIRFSVGCYSAENKDKWFTLCAVMNRLFFQLFIMRCIYDEGTGRLVCIPQRINIEVLLELPGDFLFEVDDILSFFPLLEHRSFCEVVNARTLPFDMDEDAHLVARYLKAYDDQVIDELYDPKGGAVDVLFVQDISGSMSGQKLEDSKQSIIDITNMLSDHSRVGVLIFNGSINYIHPLNSCTAGRAQLQQRIRGLGSTGGTSMWVAIKEGAEILCAARRKDVPQFLVVLSDGESDFSLQQECEQQLRSVNSMETKIIFIGVQLSVQYTQLIERICKRSPEDKIISISNNIHIKNAFQEAGQHLTVNQRIINHTTSMSAGEVRHYILKHMRPDTHPGWSRLQMAQWVRYMRRRCNILASSSTFDRNKDKPSYGSITMVMMLIQAEQAVDKNHIKWAEKAHEHMAYRRRFIENPDGKHIEDYQWSVIAVNLQEMGKEEENKRRQALEKLHMCLPTSEDLKDRRILESYLAYSLGAVLNNPTEESSSCGLNLDFPIGQLAALDQQKFVLTADSLMKMLMINERVECNVPCIMMGETGVSKTKLTQMLFHIKNHQCARCDAPIRYLNTAYYCEEETVAYQVQNVCRFFTISIPESYNGVEKQDKKQYIDLVCEHMVKECFTDESKKKDLCDALLEVFRQDPSLDPLHDLKIEYLVNIRENDLYALKVLRWCLEQNPGQRRVEQRSWMFHPVCVDSSMKADELRRKTNECAVRAHHLEMLAESFPDFHSHKNAVICIFYDEFNTSSYMGVLKEIILDRRMSGQPLPQKLVPIAACNPYRRRMEIILDSNRARETGVDWVSGHYNVHPLPRSLHDMTWDYGSLLRSQEREFIQKRLAYESITATPEEKESIVTAVLTAHCKTRELAERHLEDLESKRLGTASVDSAARSEEQARRGSSVVSVRDILRFFRMFKYFHTGLPRDAKHILFGGERSEREEIKTATVLAIAAVYYFRLGDNTGSINYRKLFCQEMKQVDDMEIEKTVSKCLKQVIRYTRIPSNVVSIHSLQENLFMILFSVGSKTPLIIKGPPGTSKTLAVQIICDNARGSYSDSELYRCFPSMVSFHYQCSRLSSSKEISEVFDRAISEQKKSDEHHMNKFFFVFMDEAGLPEEERESLKVLHYYLEDNTQRAADVGFVAITNQLLDAANSNRCNILTRGQYDLETLTALAKGCLSGSSNTVPHTAITRKGKTLSGEELVSIISTGFEAFMESSRQSFSATETFVHPNTKMPSPKECENFFGLRDFMHLFKRLKLELKPRQKLSIEDLFYAMEHSFNGLERWKVQQFILFLISCLDGIKNKIRNLRDPIQLLEESVGASENTAGPPQLRYLLVVDTTSSDGVLNEIVSLFPRRLRMTKLSDFQDDHDQQQVKAVAEVCYSAEQGYLIGLSNAKCIYDSLYDLLNQHFRVYKDHMKDPPETLLYTNIAISGHSQRCRVNSNFYGIIFMNEAELSHTPAPFLDRLEKYRIGMSDALYRYLTRLDSSIPSVLRSIVKPLYESMEKWLSSVGWTSFYGAKKKQTLDSLILWWLRKWERTACIMSAVKDYEPEDPSFGPSIAAESVDSLETMISNNEHADFFFRVAQDVLLKKLLRLAIPEKVLNSVSSSIQRMYLKDENFTINLRDPTEGTKELIFTRNASQEYLEQLLERCSPCHFRDFSTYDTATNFRHDLSEIWGKGRHILILFSIPRSGLGQLNYVRFLINQEYASRPNQSVVVVATVSAADTAVHHVFDTIFSMDWSLRFLDALHCSLMLPWMKWGYEKRDQQSAHHLESIMRECLVQSVSQLTGHLECLPHLSTDTRSFYVRHDEILKLLETQVSTDESMTLGSFLIKQFMMRWSASTSFSPRTGNPEGSLLDFQRHIQQVVEFQRVDQRTTCLTQTINEELASLLLDDVLIVLRELIPLIGADFATTTPSVESVSFLLKSLFCPENVNIARFSGRPKHTQISMLAVPGFPLYKEVHRLLSSLAEKMIGEEAPQDEEEISMIVARMKQSLKGKSSPAAQLIKSTLWELKTSDHLFHVYTDNFVADLFPHRNQSIREFAKSLLLHGTGEDCAIATLHANFYLISDDVFYYVELFASLATVSADVKGMETKIIEGMDPQELVDDECFESLSRILDGDNVTAKLKEWIASLRRAFMLSPQIEDSTPTTKLILVFFYMCKFAFYVNPLDHGSDKSLENGGFFQVLFKNLSADLLSHESSQSLEETIITFLDQYDKGNALIYVGRLPVSIRQECIMRYVEERKTLSPFPIEQEIQRIISNKGNSVFLSFESVIQSVTEDEEMNAALQQAGASPEKIRCYVASWIMGSDENNLREGYVLVQSYFCAMWNLLMEWYGEKSLAAFCLHLSDFLQKMNLKNLSSVIFLEVWKKRFVDVLATACCSDFDLSELRRSRSFQICVEVTFQDDSWVHWFAEQLRGSHSFETNIEAYLSEEDVFSPFLKNTWKKLLELKSQGLELNTLQEIMHSSSFYRCAEVMFPKEMQAVSYLRDMWMIPLLWDVYNWAARQSEHECISEALEASSTNTLQKWSVVEWFVNLRNDMPKLNREETIISLIYQQREDAEREPGKLYTIISRIMTNYQLVLEWFDSAHHSFLRISSLEDLWRYIFGEEYSEAHQSVGVNEEFEENQHISAIEALTHKFQLFSPVSVALRSSYQWSGSLPSSGGNWMAKINSVKTELCDILAQNLVIIPEHLWTPRAEFISGTRRSTEQSNKKLFQTMFHKLSFYRLKTCVNLFQMAFNVASQPSDTFKSVMEQWVDGNIHQWIVQHLEISMDESSWLLAFNMEKIREAIQYLNEQLEKRSFLFSEKSLHLKEEWPEQIDQAVEKLLDDEWNSSRMDSLHKLQSFLIEHEDQVEKDAMISDPKNSTPVNHMIPVLANGKRLTELFFDYPFLRKIRELKIGDQPFVLRSSHYVMLRLKLFLFLESKKKKNLSGNAFAAHHPETAFSPSDSSVDSLDFLLADGSGKADEMIRQLEKQFIEIERGMPLQQNKQGDIVKQNLVAPAHKRKPFGVNRGKGALSRDITLKKEIATEENSKKLLAAVKQFDNSENSVKYLWDTLDQMVGESPISTKARLILEEHEQKQKEYKNYLKLVFRTRRANIDELTVAVDFLIKSGDKGESVKRGKELLDVLNVLKKKSDFISQGILTFLDQRLIPEGFVLNSSNFSSKELSDQGKRLERFAKALVHYWGLPDNDNQQQFLSLFFPNPMETDKSFLGDEAMKEVLPLILPTKILTPTAIIRNSYEMKKLLEKAPVDRMPEKELLLSLSCAQNSEETFLDEALHYLRQYVKKVSDGAARPHGLALLATARILRGKSGHTTTNQYATLFSDSLQLCVSEDSLRGLLTKEEHDIGMKRLVKSNLIEKDQPLENDADIIKEEWRKVANGRKLSFGDDLMKMIGLNKVKREIISICKNIQSELDLPPERRLAETYHFLLLGNPGTGKTTVANLLGKMLFEVGIRKKNIFVEVTGSELLRKGIDEATKTFKSAENGVLFIDEAYGLDAAGSGKGIAMELLDIAEKKRENMTIILAGYPQEMEEKLLSVNPGFASRFPFRILFEDYSENELREIFVQFCEAKKWKVCLDAANIAARRLAKGRGRQGFGNARDARILFEKAHRRSRNRDSKAEFITTVDILGPRPDRVSIPDLDAALRELEKMVGLDLVKRRIEELLLLADSNYEREINGQPTDDVVLNRVFLGNPGTGKTTVAKLYGRILNGLGYLSKGNCELRQAKDFIGRYIGESERKTSAMIEQARGNVLLIDEAYALSTSSFGKTAIDTIVSMVHGSPGEDIAVVLIGYDKQMKEMFREVNPGLKRRFQLDQAFVFEDYDDALLDMEIARQLSQKGVKASASVRKAMLEEIQYQKCLPHFGNMGAVVNLVNESIVRMRSRDSISVELLPEDLRSPQHDEVVSIRKAFSGLFNVESIIGKFEKLENSLLQAMKEGAPKEDLTKNFIFVGPPGTGKSTVARVMASVLFRVRAISRNLLVEKTGQDLQGSYLGQTKDKVNEAMAQAQGGVLFIDEAYTLGKGHYSQEAVDQLIALMTTPEHLHKTVVVLAGYESEVREMLQSNSGLRSRFTETISFSSWSADDCIGFLTLKMQEERFSMETNHMDNLRAVLQRLVLRPDWGSARDSETTYTKLKEARWTRLSSSPENGARCFTSEDVDQVRDYWNMERPDEGLNCFTNPPAEFPLCHQRHVDPRFQVNHSYSSRQKEKEPDQPHTQCDSFFCHEEEKGREDDLIFIELLNACRNAGYDATHEQRKKLIDILRDAGSGGVFPDDILDPLRQAFSDKTTDAIMEALRPQIPHVLHAMEKAVEEEEKIRQIKSEAERIKRQQEVAQIQRKIRQRGLCPQGFDWHPEGGGWRCNGGSHWIPDKDLK